MKRVFDPDWTCVWVADEVPLDDQTPLTVQKDVRHVERS
jgi:hypothetical protein